MEPNDIDEYFAEYFEGEVFVRLRDDVLADANLSRWKTLLSHCFSNYERENFHYMHPEPYGLPP
jgi:hypothetical protein